MVFCTIAQTTPKKRPRAATPPAPSKKENSGPAGSAENSTIEKKRGRGRPKGSFKKNGAVKGNNKKSAAAASAKSRGRPPKAKKDESTEDDESEGNDSDNEEEDDETDSDE